MTLFIDNIRLYRRQIDYSDWLHNKTVSPEDRNWLSRFDDEDLLDLCSKFPHKKFVIFTAFEDTPLDHYIEDYSDAPWTGKDNAPWLQSPRDSKRSHV